MCLFHILTQVASCPVCSAWIAISKTIFARVQWICQSTVSGDGVTLAFIRPV